MDVWAPLTNIFHFKQSYFNSFAILSRKKTFFVLNSIEYIIFVLVKAD